MSHGEALQSGPALATQAHVKYIQSLDTKTDQVDYWLTEHLRLNGVYWGLNALHLLRQPDALPRQETIDFILSCQHDSGGFGAAPGHDAHMLSTVSAVQVLAMVDALDELDARGKSGGKAQVGKCASPYSMLAVPDIVYLANISKSLQVCKIQKLVAFTAMNGGRKTRASCTALSMRSPSWDSFPL